MTARAFGDLTARYVIKCDPDRPRAKIHRYSYDVNDPRAQVFERVGDGSARYGCAHIAATLEMFDAALLQQKREKYRGEDRLQSNYRLVVRALMSCLNFKTGELFPTLEKLAELTGLAYDTCCKAVERLAAAGVIGKVRRSVSTGIKDGSTPDRRQTSNAYCFPFRKIKSALSEIYWKAMAKRIKPGTVDAERNRGGLARAGMAPQPCASPDAQRPHKEPGTEEIFARMGAKMLENERRIGGSLNLENPLDSGQG